jgi:PAT family beta-lactamase induction signal transducer AmpG
MPKNYFYSLNFFIFFLGCVSALPTVLTWHCLNLWLSSVGQTPTFLASLSLMGLPYAFKIFFPPIIEYNSIYSFQQNHHWQGWLGMSALLLAMFCFYLGLNALILDKTGLIIIGLLINTCSIIFQQAFFFIKLQLLGKNELPTGIVAQRLGYKVGRSGGEALILLIAHFFNWHYAYYASSLSFLITGLFILFHPSLHIKLEQQIFMEKDSMGFSLKNTYDLIKNHHLLLFLAFFINLSGDFISPLINLYYLECGFNYEHIATIAKLWGACCFMIGTFLASYLLKRYSLVNFFIISTALHAYTLTLFPIMSLAHKNTLLFSILIFFKDVSLGCKVIASTGFFSELIRISQSKGLLYTLIATMKSLALATASFSGFFYEWLGWKTLFILDACLTIPAIILISFHSLNDTLNSEIANK